MSRHLALLVLVVSLGLSAVPRAAGQVTMLEPFYVVPVAEGVAIRCESDELWYPVTRVDPPTLLRVDAREGLWLRVEYPDDALAVVLMNDGSLDRVSGQVVLSRPSMLRAYNADDPTLESTYKDLFWDKMRPAGERLEYVRTLVDRSGNPGGYVVIAPEGAKGFVFQDDVRRATQEELDAAFADPDEGPENDTDTADDSDADTTETQTDGADTDTTEDDDATGAGGTRGSGTTDPDASDADTDPEQSTEESADAIEPVEQREPALPGSLEAVYEQLAVLDERFERVLQANDTTAEFGALASEYQAVRDGLDPAAAESENIRSYIDARLELLALREDLQQTRLRIAELRERARAVREGGAEQQEAFRQQYAAYTVVGTLRASVVYDGEDGVPLRYRVIRGSGDAVRTVAYLQPAEGVDLDSALGRFVGVTAKADNPDDAVLRIGITEQGQVEAIRRPEAAPAEQGTDSPDAEANVDPE